MMELMTGWAERKFAVRRLDGEILVPFPSAELSSPPLSSMRFVSAWLAVKRSPFDPLNGLLVQEDDHD
jgi:hypothetical protein